MIRPILTTAGLLAAITLAGCTGEATSTTATVTPATETATGTVSQTTPAAELVTYTFDVQGMHCGGCADGLTQQIAKLPGVAECSVSFEDGRAIVKAPSGVDADVMATIQAANYVATPVAPVAPVVAEAELVTWTFEVDGLHCGGCASNLGELIAGVPGVKECNVTFDDGRAVVKAEPAAADAVKAAIAGQGYGFKTVTEES